VPAARASENAQGDSAPLVFAGERPATTPASPRTNGLLKGRYREVAVGLETIDERNAHLTDVIDAKVQVVRYSVVTEEVMNLKAPS
jgi:hypothetical protein